MLWRFIAHVINQPFMQEMFETVQLLQIGGKFFLMLS